MDDARRRAIRHELAVETARELATAWWRRPGSPTRAVRRVAMGDPQAPLTTIMQVLAEHDLLAGSGFLRPDVQLLSMGDHFDFSSSDARAAAQDGLDFLRWLAVHPTEQVTILLGNHDAARVGEFATATNITYADARAACIALDELDGPDRRQRLADLERDHPDWPPMMAAREYHSFDERQPSLVRRLLLQGRIQMASLEHLPALNQRAVIATHAGVTTREWSMLGQMHRTDDAVDGLNDWLRTAIDRVGDSWTSGQPLPLDLEPFYHRWRQLSPNGGALIHRPDPRENGRSSDRHDGLDVPPAPRSVPPEQFAVGIPQLVGHSVHERMSIWFADAAGWPWQAEERIQARRDAGRVRTLDLDVRPCYWVGEPLASMRNGIIFIDGAMATTPPASYELLELVPKHPTAGESTSAV